MSRTREASPEALEREIEATREALGDTIEALARKADVKAQISAKVDQAKQRPAPIGGAIVALAVMIVLVWLVARKKQS